MLFHFVYEFHDKWVFDAYGQLNVFPGKFLIKVKEVRRKRRENICLKARPKDSKSLLNPQELRGR